MIKEARNLKKLRKSIEIESEIRIEGPSRVRTPLVSLHECFAVCSQRECQFTILRAKLFVSQRIGSALTDLSFLLIHPYK